MFTVEERVRIVMDEGEEEERLEQLRYEVRREGGNKRRTRVRGGKTMDGDK